MENKGSVLNKRVWTLFERAGFSTKPNSSDSSEHIILLSNKKFRTVDLYACEETLKVKILGWNKARRELKESFTLHIHDYEALKKLEKAQTVLFVSSEKEILPEDIEYARKYNMNVWGTKELAYYEAVVDAVGQYAKYEIIHSLGISTREEKNIHNILALKLTQPINDSAATLFLFTVTPEFLLKTAVVLRKASCDKGAYQRILQKKRLSQIRKFVATSGAILPTNIIVHFGPSINYVRFPTPIKDVDNKSVTISRPGDCEFVLLQIPMEYASLELIDGQHRLFGFVDTDQSIRQNFNLVVLGMADIGHLKRTATFVAINDNARRMDANLVAFLKYDENEEICQTDNKLMAIKLVIKLNMISPFKDKIRLHDLGEQKITLKGFAGYDLMGLLGKRGMLRKHYRHISDEYIRVLRMYFNSLKSTFLDEWSSPSENIIFTNRGISAFLKLLKSILKTTNKQLDPETVGQYLQALKKNWRNGWKTAQLKSSYVGSKGWKDFHQDLVAAIKKTYKDFLE